MRREQELSPDAARPLSLAENLALLAGAGAGKTYNLVTICLHLLSGAREGKEPLACSQLCLLTFTDKAAAELRSRLRSRLDELAAGKRGPGEEQELAASFQALGRPFPDRGSWRRLRGELGSATIGTFHSLCVQLLRGAPGGFGVDPSFQLLEEREALSLIQDTAERLVLEAVEGGESAVADLCRELGFSGQGRGKGLVDHLCEVFTKVREEGLAPEQIRLASEEEARAGFELGLSELSAQVELARGALSEKQRKFGAMLASCREALQGLTLESFLGPGAFPKLKEAVNSEPTVPQQRGAGGEALKQVRWRVLGSKDKGIAGLAELYGAWAVVAHERAFLGLLERLLARHREELARRGALDFTELLIRTRDLLRDRPEIRAEVQERIRALLVDEFQDTNRLQLELVTLLSERREGSPRAVGKDGLLPLEPGFLCAVGDRKQSIYEFRGADVSVFGVLARKIESEGGRRAYLQANWRSSPLLLEFFNRLFARLLRAPADPRDYEVEYQPAGDDLTPVRGGRQGGPCVDRIVYSPSEEDDAESCRAADAEGVARYLHALLQGDHRAQVELSDGSLRPPRGGDVAILFRRFSFLETYRQALTRHGIPHRVVRGRGFYGAQEVLDLASLLSLLADPADAPSLAAVLRSPLVALSDASLFQLAQAKGALSLRSLLSGPKMELAHSERERLQRFLGLYPRLRQEKDRLGLRTLLKVALEETGYRVAVAGAPFGEQALANLEKLLELAGRADRAGQGECAAFAREVLSLADKDPVEAQADVVDAQDPRAVQLLTIHQAKGLEWPIVVVPDLGGKRNGGGERVAFDRGLGLAIRPWVGDQDGVSSPRHREISQELRRREGAQYLRLLYVALTRARDRLVLSGASRRDGGSWWKLVDSALGEDPRLGELVRELPLLELPVPRLSQPAPAPAAPEDRERVERATSRARSPEPARPRKVVFPVTQLQDYLRCPRRYCYAHRIGLSEHPAVFELDEQAELGGSAGDSRLKGTLAHRLLERVPLSAIGAGSLSSQLQALAWEEGVDPSSGGGRELLGWVEKFLGSRFAARIGAAGAERVHRELPFLLRLGPDSSGLAVYLKGQIDLLFQDEEGGAVVVDYKASQRPREGLLPYGFQLDCYLLAARRLLREGVRVRAGVSFLRAPSAEPELRAGELDARAVEERLLSAAGQLLRNAARREWPGRELPECEAMGCGYRYRCHRRASTPPPRPAMTSTQ